MEHKAKGFTIIEVVLVLAIAGLIFAMTFIVLPSMWANERDSARQSDLLTFSRTLKNYQENNSRGALPGATEEEKDKLDRDLAIEVIGDQVNEDREEKTYGFAETSWAGFYRDYLNDTFMDPSGHPYDLYVVNCEKKNSTSALALENKCNADVLDRLDLSFDQVVRQYGYPLYIVLGATCDGAIPVKSANSRKVALLYRMERAEVRCYSN